MPQTVPPGPRGTVCSAMDSLGGPSVAAVNGQMGPQMWGGDPNMTVPQWPFLVFKI